MALIGTMDTKGRLYAFVRDRLDAAGVESIVVDAGVYSPNDISVDVSRDEVARRAGVELDQLIAAGDRGAAVSAMSQGARVMLNELVHSGRVCGVLALGGSGGTALASHAFRDVPIGFPKIIVSTVASGNTEPYITDTDLVMMPSIVDVAGLNRISQVILTNAAASMAGMVSRSDMATTASGDLVAASMFGVTTACVDAAREILEGQGSEVVVFHMTGSGGRAMERLIRQGLVTAVLDATTTELADELVGGVFSAGPDRLTAAASTAIPQVVSVGALDMVNFGPRDTVPMEFEGRNLLVHNAGVTLMRTTAEEAAELGRRLAMRISATTGPATIILPLRGVSAVSVEGGPFHDPLADLALFDAIRHYLDQGRVNLLEIDAAINDPIVAETMTRVLNQSMSDLL